jgi:hypothetical protein
LSGFAERGMKNSPDLFLPRALFMAIGLQTLAALVLRHLQTALLLQITHGIIRSIEISFLTAHGRTWPRAT